jgi:hypothetical protein
VTALRALLDLDPPGAAGLAIRRIAANTDATPVVTAATFSYLRRDCGGEERAFKWLANLAAEMQRPIALNLPDGRERSVTVFISPPDWTEERLQGYIAGRREELEQFLGAITHLSTPER